jgi:cell shape-determining protein MreD
MTVLFYILVSLCLVIIKTTIIPGLPLFDKFYDLLIPIIVYLAFFRSVKEGVPIVLFFGIIMDSLCGGPMGLYLTVYLWLYAATGWLSRFLHAGNLLILTLMVACGVVFEILVLLGYMIILAPSANLPEDALKTIALQILWALITGPLILGIIGWAQKQLDVWRTKIFAEW